MSKKITKDKAKKWADKFKKDGKGARSVMFPKADLIELLNQDKCEGLRIYNAFDDEKSQYTMMLVGTTADGTNLLPDDKTVSATATYFIWDDGQACPSYCPSNDL
jgi:hypothetical protein